jgi:hypothetical protein
MSNDCPISARFLPRPEVFVEFTTLPGQTRLRDQAIVLLGLMGPGAIPSRVESPGEKGIDVWRQKIRNDYLREKLKSKRAGVLWNAWKSCVSEYIFVSAHTRACGV